MPRSRAARCHDSVRALGLVFLLALLVLPAATAAPDTKRYVIPSDGLDRADVFQVWQVPLPEPRPSSTMTFAVPIGAFDLTVTNESRTPLEWFYGGEGTVNVVVESGTERVFITSHGAPIDGSVLRFGEERGGGRLIIALPAGVQVIEPETRDGGDAWIESRWPRLDDRQTATMVWNGTAPDALQFAPERASTTVPTALLGGLVGLLIVATLWALRLVHNSVSAPTARTTMTIMEHLEELRRRLMWVAATLVLGAVFFFTFGFRTMMVAGIGLPVPWPSIYGNAAAQTFAWLSSRVVAPGVEVIVTSPFDAVLTQMGLAFGLAVLVTFPVLFYHIYMFLAPGLTPKERGVVLSALPSVVVLFLLGAAFGLLYMMPFTVRVLYGFAGTLSATAFLNVHDLVSLGAVLAVVFGLAFQMPLVMAVTARIGLVSAQTYRDKWRHALIVIVIVAALVTDPTIVTQLAVAAVLSVLYAVGVGMAYLFERRARAEAAQHERVPVDS